MGALVAVAAVRALLARDRQVSRALLVRLAADPISRAHLLDTLHRHGRGLEIPAEHRTERATAEGHLLRALRIEQAPLVAYTWVERVEPRPGAAMHVFMVTYQRGLWDGVPPYIAIGPYPEVQHLGEPLLIWSPESPSASWLAETLADRDRPFEGTDVDAVLDEALTVPESSEAMP